MPEVNVHPSAPATGDRERHSVWKVVVLTLVLIVFFVTLTCFYQIRRTQAVVVTTFERPVATVVEPGLHVKWPWPVQKAYRFDLRTRLYQSPYAEYLIKDGNIVARSFACWAIQDVSTYKNRVGVTVADGEAIVAKLITKHVRSVLGEHSLSSIVRVTEPEKASLLAQIETDVLSLVRTEAESEFGITVSLFGFDRLELPEETTRDVFERMKSERMKMAEKITSEGKYQADKIRKEADAERSRILAEAEAEAIRIRGRAETESFEHLSVYDRNPDFALFLKKLQALERTTAKKTTLVIDGGTPPFDMLLNPTRRSEPETSDKKGDPDRATR
jgi:membrane protease subunit HflC